MSKYFLLFVHLKDLNILQITCLLHFFLNIIRYKFLKINLQINFIPSRIHIHNNIFIINFLLSIPSQGFQRFRNQRFIIIFHRLSLILLPYHISLQMLNNLNFYFFLDILIKRDWNFFDTLLLFELKVPQEQIFLCFYLAMELL